MRHPMGAMTWWIRRRGFVRLDDYGLRLTFEDRVESVRDGKVVGWRDGDVVELVPAPKPAVVLAQKPTPAPPVAPDPVVEEDDWEWEIAMARARAAAEEIEQSVVELTRPKVALVPA